MRASFVARGFEKNAIFDLNHPSNRDNCFQPYHLMREKLGQHGIELNTVDINVRQIVAFNLHMDVQRPDFTKPCYLLMLETPQVWPANGADSDFALYQKVFTWNDALVDGKRFVKINFPNPIHIHPVDGFSMRDRFCCLIAGNRTLSTRDDRILYEERIKAIRWYEQHASTDFDLYGVDWDMPVIRRGFFGRLERRLWRKLSRYLKLRPFPSYRGKVAHKRDVLRRTRFAICYENVRDLPGYITEKIFDCFFSGCVPVYWGASNIQDHVPADCFVDRRQFRNIAEVYDFLKAMTECDFKGYQDRIAAFLRSDKAIPFSSEFFAETIVKTVVQDIGNQI